MSDKFLDLQPIRIKRTLIPAGTNGVVVHVHQTIDAYEVELDAGGHTQVVCIEGKDLEARDP